jgi:hypothetical protein
MSLLTTRITSYSSTIYFNHKRFVTLLDARHNHSVTEDDYIRMGYSVTLRIQAPGLLHFLPIIPHLSRYRLLLLFDLLPYPPTSFHYFTFRVAYAPLLSPLTIRLLYSSSLLFIFCSTLYLVECRSDIYPDFPRIALWFISLRMLFSCSVTWDGNITTA